MSNEIDKRELLKGYGVVCRTQKQADKMVEFVGGMFNDINRFKGKCKTLQYSKGTEAFVWQSETIYIEKDFNHLGNKTYEEACAMCRIGEVEPSFENPVEMLVNNSKNQPWRKRRVVKFFEDGSCLALMDQRLGTSRYDFDFYTCCKPIEQEQGRKERIMRTGLNLELIGKINVDDFYVFHIFKSTKLGSYMVGTSCGIFPVYCFRHALRLITLLTESNGETFHIDGRLTESFLRLKGKES